MKKNSILANFSEKRRKLITNLVSKHPELAEDAVMPTVSDIYSHAGSGRDEEDEFLKKSLR
ncbi:MAG: hypothetical protein U5O15_08250 [Candidatus Krumholzibacteriota bacterium]|nr:hypothetical protein [Candidatus Krumholzibacteriota bacterium]